MNVEEALATVLERLSDDQVHALADACEPLGSPDARIARVTAGASPGTGDAVAALAKAWRERPVLTGAGVALALRLGLVARREAHARRARPVWTGPGTLGEQRLTAAVLHELLVGARKRILLVSYAAYTLPEVGTDLEAAVDRGCQVDVVFETTEDSAGAYTGPERPFAQLTGINRWRWPPDQRSAGGLLHAKLLVVDGQDAFVGSANLTRRALNGNIEAGVLVRDAVFATSLEHHIHALIAAGTLTRE